MSMARDAVVSKRRQGVGSIRRRRSCAETFGAAYRRESVYEVVISRGRRRYLFMGVWKVWRIKGDRQGSGRRGGGGEIHGGSWKGEVSRVRDCLMQDIVAVE